MAEPKTLKKPAKPPKVPKSFGACADRLIQLKAEKKPYEEALEKLDEERKAIEEYIINNLPKSQTTGVTGKLGHVRLVPSVTYHVKDWDSFRAYIVKTKAWELLQKRAADTSIKERVEAGVKVPGVEPFNYVKVSVTKA